MTPEQKLFRAIVSQCVIDATAFIPADPDKEKWQKGWLERAAKKGKEVSDIDMAQAWKQNLCIHKCNVNVIIRDRDEAQKWLILKSRDFYLICGLAGFDPDYIHDNARKLERNGWKPAAPNELVALAA